MALVGMFFLTPSICNFFFSQNKLKISSLLEFCGKKEVFKILINFH